jgi:hypothetical protein
MKTITATAIVSAASACLSSLIFVGVLNVATTSDVGATIAPVQTITVSAKRMSDEDKLAYDMEMAQLVVMQVVEVRGKRLTAAEKARMASE